MHPHFLKRKSGAKLLLFFHICKDLAQKKAPKRSFSIVRVSVLPARSCRTDRYVSCQGRDRVCRGVGQHDVPPSPGTADDSDLSRYAMPLGKRLSSVRTGPARQACADPVYSPAVHTHTLPSDRIRKPGRQGNAILSFASPDASVLKTCRLIHRFRLL